MSNLLPNLEAELEAAIIVGNDLIAELLTVRDRIERGTVDDSDIECIDSAVIKANAVLNK